MGIKMNHTAQAGLFDPLEIQGLHLPNRIVMPPMGMYLAGAAGEVTDSNIQHYLARANAHPGLIIVEFTYVALSGRPRVGVLGIDNDSQIAGLRRLATAVKQTGTLAAIQIAHHGAHAPSSVTGHQPLGPSDVVPPGAVEMPRALTIEEIADLVRAFGDAAARAAEAGFDLVELHGAHGFLLSEFVSPYTNRRQDS